MSEPSPNHRPSWKGRTTPMYPWGEGAPAKTCHWCGEPLRNHERKWCGGYDYSCAQMGGWWVWFNTRTNSSSNWQRTVVRVLWRDNYTCQRCGTHPEGSGPGWQQLEAHHIIPRNEGGTDDDENLITLCVSCHDHPTAHPKLHHRAFGRWKERDCQSGLALEEVAE